MAVYKRSYRPYAGPLTAVKRRWLVVSRFSLATTFASRISIVSFVICLMPSLVAALLIYIANNELVQAAMKLRGSGLLINNTFFFIVFQIQGWLAFFFAAWIGPASIAPDLANNALPLFLSRPLSRTEYVGGKLLVLCGLLSAITWIPLLLLFALQSQLAPAGWFQQNWYLAPGIFFGSLLWIAVLGLLALAVSSWVKWRIIASGATIAILLVPAGFGGVIMGVLRTHWGLLFNVPYLMTLIWSDLLHIPLPPDVVPVSAAWAVMAATALLSMFLLARRIQARQVVRG